MGHSHDAAACCSPTSKLHRSITGYLIDDNVLDGSSVGSVVVEWRLRLQILRANEQVIPLQFSASFTELDKV